MIATCVTMEINLTTWDLFSLSAVKNKNTRKLLGHDIEYKKKLQISLLIVKH